MTAQVNVFSVWKFLEYGNPYCNFRFSRMAIHTPSTENWNTGSGKECCNVPVHKNYFTLASDIK